MALWFAVLMIHARGNSGTPGRPPLVHSGCEGLLSRFFGQVEIADEPDQGGNNPAPIGAVDCLDGFGGLWGHS
jgi:hypothetical protein